METGFGIDCYFLLRYFPQALAAPGILGRFGNRSTLEDVQIEWKAA
jgi:hypothetical protein